MRNVSRMKLKPPWRASEFLQHAENLAAHVRKDLRAWRADEASGSASKDDAERLAGLVELLARHGRSEPADVAGEIAERLENLLNLLVHEIDKLLSSGR